MAKTKYPKRMKYRRQRLIADCERRLNTPWPEQATTEKEQRAAARALKRTRYLPERK